MGPPVGCPLRSGVRGKMRRSKPLDLDTSRRPPSPGSRRGKREGGRGGSGPLSEAPGPSRSGAGGGGFWTGASGGEDVSRGFPGF